MDTSHFEMSVLNASAKPNAAVSKKEDREREAKRRSERTREIVEILKQKEKEKSGKGFGGERSR